MPFIDRWEDKSSRHHVTQGNSSLLVDTVPEDTKAQIPGVASRPVSSKDPGGLSDLDRRLHFSVKSVTSSHESPSFSMAFLFPGPQQSDRCGPQDPATTQAEDLS